MKITEIEVGEIFVPLAKPFKTALRTVANVEDIVVRITTDTGAAGYGEAPPTAVITGDTKVRENGLSDKAERVHATIERLYVLRNELILIFNEQKKRTAERQPESGHRTGAGRPECGR